jgi:hypothetical protein
MRKRKAKAPAPIPMSAPTVSASASASSSSAPLDLPAASQDLGNDPAVVMGGIDPPPNSPIPSLSTDDSTASSDIEAGTSSTVTMPATSNASKGNSETLQGEDIESGSDGDNEVDEVDFYGDDEVDEFESDEEVEAESQGVTGEGFTEVDGSVVGVNEECVNDEAGGDDVSDHFGIPP